MIAWYAVHTRPQAEATALENLLRQGYAAYLPRYRTQIRHARRLKTVLRPLFPRYLFAGVDRTATRWRPMLSTVGVSDVVRAGDEPIPVATSVLDVLRQQEEAGALDRLAGRRPLRLGDLVQISAGAFEDMIGRLVDLRDEDRVIVLLDILGRKVRTVIAAEAIETV
jgi:transcriptional antiterminator RfaH